MCKAVSKMRDRVLKGETMGLFSDSSNHDVNVFAISKNFLYGVKREKYHCCLFDHKTSCSMWSCHYLVKVCFKICVREKAKARRVLIVKNSCCLSATKLHVLTSKIPRARWPCHKHRKITMDYVCAFWLIVWWLLNLLSDWHTEEE